MPSKKNPHLSSEAPLTEVVYQFIQLYERWAVEHQQVARREAEMARLLEHFEEQLSVLEALHQQMPAVITETNQESARLIAHHAEQSIQRSMTEHLDKLNRQLSHTIDDAERVLKSYQVYDQESRFMEWLKCSAITWVSCVLVAVIVAFAVR